MFPIEKIVAKDKFDDLNEFITHVNQYLSRNLYFPYLDYNFYHFLTYKAGVFKLYKDCIHLYVNATINVLLITCCVHVIALDNLNVTS